MMCYPTPRGGSTGRPSGMVYTKGGTIQGRLLAVDVPGLPIHVLITAANGAVHTPASKRNEWITFAVRKAPRRSSFK